MPDGARMHRHTEATRKLREKIFEYATERMDFDPAPLDGPKSEQWFNENVPPTVTEKGLGGEAALEIFKDKLATATISTDHPNFLAFIPNAPSEAASLFDLIVSASSIFGGSWLEGAGAVHAENEVLRFLAREVGLPDTAGGVFVQGGTLGNLSALVTAREYFKNQINDLQTSKRWGFFASEEAHSSLKAVAKVMDVEIVLVPVDEQGRMRKQALEIALQDAGRKNIQAFAVVGTSGTTNFGTVDRLDEVADFAKQNRLWFHIDGAYGLAGILSPLTKKLFKGSEHCDSFIVDPHKWLFSPYDACALVYREPKYARAAHIQKGEYLETLNKATEHNPSDYAFNLTRRVRGLPLWFSIATHGVSAYRDAITENIECARLVAEDIKNREYLTLIREPDLSVVVFERNGWNQSDYDNWSQKLMESGFAFVLPSSHKSKPNTRFAIVNPKTRLDDLLKILDGMR